MIMHLDAKSMVVGGGGRVLCGYLIGEANNWKWEVTPKNANPEGSKDRPTPTLEALCMLCLIRAPD